MIVPLADSPFAGMMLELIDDGQNHPKSDLRRRSRKPEPEAQVRGRRGRRRLVALVAAAGLVLIAAMSVVARLG